MSDAVTITIGGGGRLAFIYRDDLGDLLTLGAARVERASHVEPVPMDGTVGWTATIVADGAVLGPFRLRQEALDAEIAWLKEHHGL